MSVRYASTFLSHSSAQKDFAGALGRELGRRGVIAWLDRNELFPGIDLDAELQRAAEAQLTMTALISAESLASPWCREELAPRLARADDDAIIPVYFGPHLDLVRNCPVLRSRWLTPDGTRVRKLGVQAGDPEAADIGKVACEVARTHYKGLEMASSAQLVVVLDQRGSGRRVGRPDCLPHNWQAQAWPVLVFRPDQRERSTGEVLHGEEWATFRTCVVGALGDATGTRRSRDVYVAGNAQLALAWLLGWHFDRNSGVRLVAYNPGRGGQYLEIDLNDQCFQSPLTGVNAADVEWCGRGPDARTEEVSVYLGRSGTYEQGVHKYRLAKGDTTPLAAREVGHVETKEDVIGIARWVSAVSSGRATRVYTSLPFHAVPLLAALLKHTAGHVTVMEWDRAETTYHPCPMPRG